MSTPKPCRLCDEPVSNNRSMCWVCSSNWYSNSGRIEAVAQVTKAKRLGLLPDLKKVFVGCTDCDKRATDYDHRDYQYPLLVEPVCRGCNVKRGPAKPKRDFKVQEVA